MSEKPVPLDKKLYEKVKQMANKKFESKSGIYRSSWIVKKYLSLGGKYSGKKPQNSGLKRWFSEKWVNINTGKSKKIVSCGTRVNGKYPVCRPTINKTGTPRLLKSINNKQRRSAIAFKNKFKQHKYFQFGKGKAQFYGKTSDVMIKVPELVKKTALYAFQLKKYGFEGGVETGWKRAKQLATKEYIPIQDLRYMKNWFARHIFTSYPGYKAWIKAGRPKNDPKWHKRHAVISWLIWSGDAAFKWVNSQKNINLLNKYFPGKNYKSIKLN